MRQSRYFRIAAPIALGLLVLGQYACSHAGPVQVPEGTKLILFVDEKGDVKAVSPDGKPLQQCLPCPKEAVTENHSCKVELVDKLPVCKFLTNVSVTDVVPLTIMHSKGSCYWGYVFRNGYFYYTYICT